MEGSKGSILLTELVEINPLPITYHYQPSENRKPLGCLFFSGGIDKQHRDVIC